MLAASQEGSPRTQATQIRDTYLDALRRSEALGMRPLSAHGHHKLGLLHATLSETTAAREHLQHALALYREMGMEYWRQQADAELQAIH